MNVKSHTAYGEMAYYEETAKVTCKVPIIAIFKKLQEYECSSHVTITVYEINFYGILLIRT